jgi:hypothetical protein
MSVFGAVPMTPLVVRADRPPLDEAQLAAVAVTAQARPGRASGVGCLTGCCAPRSGRTVLGS